MVYSVITIVYNSEEIIEDTILNVLDLNSNDAVEYIIVDGGSTDGTLEIIKKYRNRIAKFISEPDEGIYDALNKGIENSSGDIILMVHAGDLIERDALLKFESQYGGGDFKNTIFFGNTAFVDSDGFLISYLESAFNSETLSNGIGFMHPSTLVSKDLFEKIGKYSLDYSIAGDSDFLLRAFKSNVIFKKIDFKNYMLIDGVSEDKIYSAEIQYSKVLKENGLIDNFSFYKRHLIIFLKFGLIKQIFKRSLSVKVKTQIWYFIIATFNFLYFLTPTFFIKNKLLRAFRISIGKHSYIHRGVTFLSIGKLQIGRNSVINQGCLLDNRGQIEIGNCVNISHGSKIYTAGHDLDDMFFTGRKRKVKIGDHVCIFSNVIIMPGVIMQEGSVALPGSVITKDVQPFSVVGGNPAKHIKWREKDLRYKLKFDYWFAK